MPEFSCVDYRGMLDREEITALLNASGIGLCLMAEARSSTVQPILM